LTSNVIIEEKMEARDEKTPGWHGTISCEPEWRQQWEEAIMGV
jgi:hypothetical protein